MTSITSSGLDEETKLLLIEEINSLTTLEGDSVKLKAKKKDGTPIELTINISHIIKSQPVSQQESASEPEKSEPTVAVDVGISSRDVTPKNNDHVEKCPILESVSSDLDEPSVTAAEKSFKVPELEIKAKAVPENETNQPLEEDKDDEKANVSHLDDIHVVETQETSPKEIHPTSTPITEDIKLQLVTSITSSGLDEEAKLLLIEEINNLATLEGDSVKLKAKKKDGAPIELTINISHIIKSQPVPQQESVSEPDKSKATVSVDVGISRQDLTPENNDHVEKYPIPKAVSAELDESSVMPSEKSPKVLEPEVKAEIVPECKTDQPLTPLTEDIKLQLLTQINSSGLDEETRQLLSDEINKLSTLEGDSVKLSAKKKNGTPIELTINISHIIKSQLVPLQVTKPGEEKIDSIVSAAIDMKDSASTFLEPPMDYASDPNAEKESKTITLKEISDEGLVAEDVPLESDETFIPVVEEEPLIAVEQVPAAEHVKEAVQIQDTEELSGSEVQPEHTEAPHEECMPTTISSDEPNVTSEHMVDNDACSTPLTYNIKQQLTDSIMSSDLDDETKYLILEEINQRSAFEGDTVTLKATKKDETPIVLTINISHIINSKHVQEESMPQASEIANDSIDYDRTTEPLSDKVEEFIFVFDEKSHEQTKPAGNHINVNLQLTGEQESSPGAISFAITPVTEEMKEQLMLLISSSDVDEETKELLAEEINKRCSLEGDCVKLEAVKKDGTPVVLSINVSYTKASSTVTDVPSTPVDLVLHEHLGTVKAKEAIYLDLELTSKEEILSIDGLLKSPLSEDIRQQLIISITSSDLDEEAKQLFLEGIDKNLCLEGDHKLKVTGMRKDRTLIELFINITSSINTSQMLEEPAIRQSAISDDGPDEINRVSISIDVNVKISQHASTGTASITDELKSQISEAIMSSNLDQDIKELIIEELSRCSNIEGEQVQIKAKKKDGTVVECVVNIKLISDPQPSHLLQTIELPAKSIPTIPSVTIDPSTPVDVEVSDPIEDASKIVHLNDVHITIKNVVTHAVEGVDNPSIPVGDKIRIELLRSLKASTLDDESRVLLEDKINQLDKLDGTQMKLTSTKKDGNPINLIISISHVTKETPSGEDDIIIKSAEMYEKDVLNIGDVSLLVSSNVEDSPILSPESGIITELTKEIKLQIVDALKCGEMNEDLIDLFSAEVEKLNQVEGDEIHLSCQTHDGIPVELTIDIKNILLNNANADQALEQSSQSRVTKDAIKLTEEIKIVSSSKEEAVVSTPLTVNIRSQIIESLRAGNVDTEIISLISNKLNSINEIPGKSMIMTVKKEDGTLVELTIKLTHVKNFFRAIPPLGGTDDNDPTANTDESLDETDRGSPNMSLNSLKPAQSDYNDGSTSINKASPTDADGSIQSNEVPDVEEVNQDAVDKVVDETHVTVPMTDEIKSQIIDSLKTAELDDETFIILKEEIDKIQNLKSDRLKLSAARKDGTPIDLTINVNHITKDFMPMPLTTANEDYEIVDIPTQSCADSVTLDTGEYEMIKDTEREPGASTEIVPVVSYESFELVSKAEEGNKDGELPASCDEGFELLATAEIPEIESSEKQFNQCEPSSKDDSDDSYEFVAKPESKEDISSVKSPPLQPISCQCSLTLAEQEADQGVNISVSEDIKSKLTNALQRCELDDESINLLVQEFEKSGMKDYDTMLLNTKKSDGTPVHLTLNISRISPDDISIPFAKINEGDLNEVDTEIKHEAAEAKLETPVTDHMKAQIIESLQSGKLDDETIQLMKEELDKVDAIQGDTINLATSKADGTPISLTINIKHIVKNIVPSLVGIENDDYEIKKKIAAEDEKPKTSDLLLESCNVDDSSEEDIAVEEEGIKDVVEKDPISLITESKMTINHKIPELSLESCDVDDSSDEDIAVEEEGIEDVVLKDHISLVTESKIAIDHKIPELSSESCDVDDETIDDDIFVEEKPQDITETATQLVEKPEAPSASVKSDDIEPHLKPILVTEDVKFEILASLKSSGLDDETIALLEKELENVESVEGDSINLSTAKKDGTPINLTINIKHIVRSVTPVPFGEEDDSSQILLESQDIEEEVTEDDIVVEEDVKAQVERAPLAVEPIEITDIDKDIKNKEIWKDDQEYFLLEGVKHDVPISHMLSDNLADRIKNAIKNLDIPRTAQENLISELDSLNMIPYGENGILKTADSRIEPVTALVNLVIEHLFGKDGKVNKNQSQGDAELSLVEVVVDVLDYCNVNDDGK